MKRVLFAPVAFAAVAALSLSACNKKSDDAAESTADAIESYSDTVADSMDTKADNMTNEASEAVLHDKADAVRDQGKHKADEVEDSVKKSN